MGFTRALIREFQLSQLASVVLHHLAGTAPFMARTELSGCVLASSHSAVAITRA
jgi:hypothetical protein